MGAGLTFGDGGRELASAWTRDGDLFAEVDLPAAQAAERVGLQRLHVEVDTGRFPAEERVDVPQEAFVAALSTDAAGDKPKK